MSSQIYKDLKHCIWCKRTEEETKFDKIAHTIPQSLGGKYNCTNVCDQCNTYFGSTQQSLPAIELVLKETFNISRVRYLLALNKVGKNKALAKFSSIYFNVNYKKHRISIKPRYSLYPSFQKKIGRQIRRGIYKMYLEELERQYGKGHDEKYNFIREFARYNIGEYPVFYFEGTHGIIMYSDSWTNNPELWLEKDIQMKFLIRDQSFTEFEFFGHVFGIVTSRVWDINFHSYAIKSARAKKGFFHNAKVVQNFNDIDLTLKILG